MVPMRLAGFVDDLVGSAVTSAVNNYVPRAVRSVSVRTAFSPETEIVTGKEIVDLILRKDVPPAPPTAGTRFLYALRPTVTVKSEFFKDKDFAPYGVASATEYKKNTGKIIWSLGLVAAGLFTAGYALGRG